MEPNEREKKYGKGPKRRRIPNILFLNKIKTQSDVSKPKSWQPESSEAQRSTFRRETETSNGPRFQGVHGRGSCNQRAGQTGRGDETSPRQNKKRERQMVDEEDWKILEDTGRYWSRSFTRLISSADKRSGGALLLCYMYVLLATVQRRMS